MYQYYLTEPVTTKVYDDMASIWDIMGLYCSWRVDLTLPVASLNMKRTRSYITTVVIHVSSVDAVRLFTVGILNRFVSHVFV